MMKERDGSDKQFDDLTEKMRDTNQCLAGLQHEARQPRLAAEADIEPDTKTRKRTMNAAADRVKNADSSSIRVIDGPTCLTSFEIIGKPLLIAPKKLHW